MTNEEFIESNAVWRVKTTDGADYTLAPSLSWLALRSLCLERNLGISRLSIHFRSNSLHLWPDNAEGYFFIRGAACDWSSSTMSFYSVGHVVGNKVYVKKIQVPELIVFDEEVRKLSACPEECLICRPI